MNTRNVYRLLSILGDVKAASRGPGSYGRRVVRRSAHRRGCCGRCCRRE